MFFSSPDNFFRSRGFLFLFILLQGPGALVFSRQNDQRATELVQKGLRAQDMQKKIQLFEQALALEPHLGDALYHLARAYYQTENYQKAIEKFNLVVQTDSTRTNDVRLYLRNAYAFEAQNLLQQQRFQLAGEYARESLRIDRDFGTALTVLGIVYFNTGESDKAIQTLEKSVQTNPNQKTAWIALGDAYVKRAAYAHALNAYQHALDLSPGSPEIEEKVSFAREQNSPETWLRKFTQTVEEADLEAGIRLLEQAKKDNPHSPEIASALRNALLERDYGTAVAAMKNKQWELAFQTLQSIDPNYKDTALKLEETRAELLLAKTAAQQDNQFADTLASAVKADSSGPPVHSVRRPPNDAGTKMSPGDSLQTRMTDDSAGRVPKKRPVAGVQPFEETLLDSASLDSIVRANQFPEVQQAQKTTAQPQTWRDKLLVYLHTPYVIVAASAGVILLIILVVVLRRKPIPVPTRESLEETLRSNLPRKRPPGASVSDGTDELFQERIASQTPVRFQSPHRKRRTHKGKKIVGEKMDEQQLKALSLQETKTLIGGVTPAKQIGRYVIESEIGRGSMGRVFKAWDPKLDRTVVIKQVSFDLSIHNEELDHLRSRLYREARAAASLNHPNIVIVYDVAEERDFSYIVMEYVEGLDLQSLLQKERRPDIRKAIRIVQQICLALDFAHQHDIVHRDVKPSNILLTNDGKVKVADFGIAKLPQTATLTHTGNVMGTPYYMSPEQIEGKPLDGRSDIFSLGVLMYELFTGVRPFVGESIPAVVYKIMHKNPAPPSFVNKSLPETLDRVVEKALAKEPQHRFSKTSELLNELQNLERTLTQ